MRLRRSIDLILMFFVTSLSMAQELPVTLRLTFGHKDQEPVRWTGHVSITGARVERLEGWLFVEQDHLSLDQFDILTGGPLQKGLTLVCAALPDARIDVRTDHGTFSTAFSKLRLAQRLQFLDGAAVLEKLPDATRLTDDTRQDDYPSIVAAADSTAWAVWQSYSGRHDEVRIARYDGTWKHFTPLPGVSGDVWRPQVALDSRQRPVVVWSQQVSGNFDLYSRTLDPETNRWHELIRLSSSPLADIDHHFISGQRGSLWLVWQGFRGDNSDIFLRHFDGSSWSPQLAVTSNPSNDWVPRIAVDRQDRAYIVWDTYRNGNYDVYLRIYQDGEFRPEVPIASTARFEAHPSVAVDQGNRVWIAWEESGVNWGKDRGHTADANWREIPAREREGRSPGTGLYQSRNINMIVLDGGRRKSPAGLLTDQEPGDTRDSPQLLIDPGTHRIGLLFDSRKWAGQRGSIYPYWESALTFYEDGAWTEPVPLPWSWGRISALPAASYDEKGNLWVTWPTDGRLFRAASRPVAGNVYAAHIPLQGAPGTPVLDDEAFPEEPLPPTVHEHERADVRAIRDYRTFVNGIENRIVRGDFHRHTELSTDLGGWRDGSLHDFYRYVLDAAALDFAAVTDHFAGGHYEYWWWLSEKSCDMYHVPRSFTTFYAYERSARFPNGHRNIIHTTRGVPVVRFFTEATFGGPGLGPDSLTANDTKLLYESLRGSGGISIPHTSSSSFMGTDWRDNDPQVEPVVEIFQGDRVSSEHPGAPRAARSSDDRPMGGFQEAGFLWNAYAKGYRLGTIASSDHVSTHMSYAMVYTEQPTREAIFRAIQRRHTYGATDNIILDYRMGEHFMGEECTSASVPPLTIHVIGTSQVATVEIIKNEEIIYTATPNRKAVNLTFVDQDPSPGTSYYYVRVLQQDRQIAWSSPIWVTLQP